MQQQGGSQYGVPPPEMTPFPSSAAGAIPQMFGISSGPVAEAASPISCRPPSRPPPSGGNFDELGSAVAGNFPDEDALAAAGEEVERGGNPGNRWPRQETLALLKIRSEMDAAFRDATLKTPLWENVSRKLAELGYTRSAKKCKEKFENVHKYYKRTKEGRAGRQDGKSYRFFTQLEALHSSSSGGSNPASTTPPCNPSTTNTTGISSGGMVGPPFAIIQPTPISTQTPPPVPISAPPVNTAGPPPAGLSLSSNTSSSSSAGSDDEETDEAGGVREGRKRKRGGAGSGGGGGRRKMMAFFEGLMKQVIERQEVMQQKFLETIEKREQERMIREEAWKRQEMARLNREHELMVQERAMAASRDATVVTFLQKLSGGAAQTIQLSPPTTIPAAVTAAATPPQPSPSLPPQQRHQKSANPLLVSQPPPPPKPTQQKPPPQTDIIAIPDQPQEIVTTGGFEMASPSRWPKSEVHALIKLRSGLESRYQEAGPKGPLWEEISAGMQRLGYNRSSKRCKEKWENINKYFKKVKESNKKRPEDAKTCPYFHQLDALYCKKLLGSTASGNHQRQLEQDQTASISNPDPPPESADVLAITPPPPPPPSSHQPPATVDQTKNDGRIPIQTSNGGLPPSFFEEGPTGGDQAMIKKPEDIVKELMDQQQQQQNHDYDNKLEDLDSDMTDRDDDVDDDDEDDDDDDNQEGRKLQYEIQFQRQNVSGGGAGGGGGGNASAKPTATATGSSFLAMVQ